MVLYNPLIILLILFRFFKYYIGKAIYLLAYTAAFSTIVTP
jgi:hypothetical protein